MMKFVLICFCAATLFACKGNTDKPLAEAKKNEMEFSTKNYEYNKPDTLGERIEVKYYPSGKKKTEGKLVNGLRQGLWKSWHENGNNWSETTFEKGILTGPTKTWFENGTLRYSGFYKNGTRSGTWRMWDEAGNFLEEVKY